MKDNGPGPIQDHISEISNSSFRSGLPTFNAEEFREFIDKLDATEEEKIEYLNLLWRIAITVVDISFGVDSTQQAISSTRKMDREQDHDSTQESPLVNFESYPQQFNKAAVTEKAGRKRRKS